MADPTLTSAPEPDHPTATVAGSGGAAGHDAPSAPSGYELHSLIGRGGMGAVYRARHLSLTRDVAVKFLLKHYAPESVTAWRFVEEARITARLQHPGIPPVHEVGTLPDGRPYLAMKLIKGHTLEDLLKARTTPADERGRFVGVFEQIAQAVAFAHSRRIIHRDLKPANVMVGDFGEVQVMDWGLAKELGEGQPADPTRSDVTLSVELRLGRDGGDVTQAGSLLGTPAFMPPEQAIGAIDLVTERSDVFGLGAILCVILTGKPPFVAESAESTRQIAARGKLDDAFARLDACGAEPELIALAKRCLSPEACDRPADAGEVAKAVAALRADAERRARQAETDRATTEVKIAEERKRRRVQRALALAVVALFAIAGFAGWWVESVRSARRADQQANEIRHEADRKERDAELKVRQLTTERDVNAALNEARVLREQGLKQADDTERWALTLVAARSSLRRAESLIVSGEPTDDLRARVAVAGVELDRDDRDRALLAELDRIADNNEIRLIIPISFTSVVSRQYATTFRANGIDLAEVPTEEAVAWLKNHRFRDRLAIAIRAWVFSLSPTEGAIGFDIHGATVIPETPGQPKPAPVPKKPNRRERLQAILTAVVDDPFTREWWAAVASYNGTSLKKLLTRPELHRMSSRELASLAEGLSTTPFWEVQRDLMALAYDRFPGEFWVHFRLAFLADFGAGKADPKGPKLAHETLRHLTAAVAARPRSGIARSALGMALLEIRKDDPAGFRMLKSAGEVDPTSPWPHLFLGMEAVERASWTEATDPFKSAVRADPDTAYFMMHTMFDGPGGTETQEHIWRIVEEVAAVNPNYIGSLDLLGELHIKKGNYRAALVAFRKADKLATEDYARKPLLAYQLAELEAKAKWEGKIPVAPDDTVTPANSTEGAEIAGYYAQFEKKYARAVQVAAASLNADPTFFANWVEVSKIAGWAVQAASGNGVDAADLKPAERTRLRQHALAWLRESQKQLPKALTSGFGARLYMLPDLHPVRDAKERAKLPPDEQDEWIKFWLEVAPIKPPEPPKPHAREVAPPPRPVK